MAKKLKLLQKSKDIAAVVAIISLFLTVVSGAWLLLVEALELGAFSYSCYGFVVSLASYFLIEFYQKSK